MQKQFIGLPSYVLKAIGATKTDGPEFDAIRTACDESKIQYSSPGVVGETVVHFAFPKHKTALIIRSNGAGSAPKDKALQCENMGWEVSTVHISTLRHLTREAIIAQFKEYIGTLKIKK
jgi:hypothetical protein